MPNQEDKPEFVRENFEKIASRYDIFNDWNSFFLHRSWKNRLVKILTSYKPEKVLDLCCGTGDIAFRISKLPTVQKLFAVDFSPSMLSVATARLKDEAPERVTTSVGVAMDLKEFEDVSLDAVTIGFGLRNVQDLRKCLREIGRVLKPGGVYLNLDVGKVKNPVIRYFANFYFFKIVPIFGYLLWGGKNEMFDYLPVSSLSYPGQIELKNIMEEEGFVNVRYENFVFGNATLHICEKKKQ
ncbi:MAG: ubiquinone/menaquinone biosynthesis methyltransferase [Leptospira sp.]|nr:ubiquinone/menaquinone biosynthesis methyltransferase [Leptospira sp.]